MTGDPVSVNGRAELRALFEDAAAGLSPGEREVVELQLRQGLETGEVATVLGVSRNHASRCWPGPGASSRPAWARCSSAGPGAASAASSAPCWPTGTAG